VPKGAFQNYLTDKAPFLEQKPNSGYFLLRIPKKILPLQEFSKNFIFPSGRACKR
jgi:hypothetical protein